MNRTRTLVVALVVVAALLAVGTGSYSSVATDRGINLGVASEGNGLIAIQPASDSVTVQDRNSPSKDLVEITNNLDTEVAIDVEPIPNARGPPPVKTDNANDPQTVEVDDTRYIDRHINCQAGQSRTETWTITVTAAADGTTVTKSVDVTVECDVPPTPTQTPTS